MTAPSSSASRDTALPVPGRAAEGLRLHPDDVIVLPGRGLQLPRQLTFDRWLSVGRQLSDIYTSSAWCLGDWLVYGEAAYHGRYRDAIEQTSLDYQTLRNYAWVVKRFALSRRRDSLSFGHHAEVAALPEAEQDYWLRKAEEHGWPVKRLRREVRGSMSERSDGNPSIQSGSTQPGLPSPTQPSQARLQIHLTPEQLQACRAAADRAHLTTQDWAALALCQAARHALDIHLIHIRDLSQPDSPRGPLSSAAQG